jgi:nitric oxide reductase NorD protein
VSRRALARFPGLGEDYRRLAEACRHARPNRSLPPVEAEVEAAIVALLGGPADPAAGSAIRAAIEGSGPLPGGPAPKGYRPHLPVLIWGESLPLPPRAAAASEDEPPPPGADDPGGEERTRKGRRDEAPDTDRNDPLILNRFEKILSWAEFLRINRGVDDDDEETAKRAADDHAEITLVKHQRRAATRLKFDLDLSPADVDRERLAGTFLYPEWDYRRQAYLPDHCRVLAGPAAGDDAPPPWQPDQAARRRIEAVRRQFEALRPKREILRGQIDGEDLDMDALIRARCDLQATGDGNDRIYLQARQQARDLAVAVLIDVSRSTESYVDNRPVIDIAREALTALTAGLTAVGDDHALYSFSSLRRERVWVETIKDFGDVPAAVIQARIARLRPGHYTRLGAALRHVAARLAEHPRQRRLLLVLTDGKPNDLDHYEGRYGIEDTARAIREARRQGHAIFGITIDRKAQAYFPQIFGRNAFAIVPHPAALTAALPLIYHHVVA